MLLDQGLADENIDVLTQELSILFEEELKAKRSKIIMNIAIPIAGGKLCAHFGHCEQFALINADMETKKILDTKLVNPPAHEPGVLPKWLHEQGANIIIAGGMGSRAQDLFTQNDIEVIVGAGADTPEAVAEAYLQGSLDAGSNACDH